ncbi:CbrC family protein [Dactylosporangium sp. CA-092794]|uniref:CbrC family protein n=1 Tax=Dactylosporangium sp. CA-092794 TaxID=3239929 RepID=UPI003D8D075D
MATFVELGISVPLFLGDVTCVEGLAEARNCALCGRRGPCPPLDDVLVPCPGCGAQVCVRPRKRATDRRDPCPRCHTQADLHGVLTPDVAEALRQGLPARLHGCVWCLRAGRWAQAHVTEAGAVGWEHGGGPDWRTDLLRTPRYATFQGERWLFCHELPMVYLGEWGRLDFDAARPGAGRELFAGIVLDVDPADVEDAWESGLGPTGDASDLKVYAFRCQRCAALRTHSDAG